MLWNCILMLRAVIMYGELPDYDNTTLDADALHLIPAIAKDEICCNIRAVLSGYSGNTFSNIHQITGVVGRAQTPEQPQQFMMMTLWAKMCF